MRITGFHAENFKRLKAVDITPDANTVVIAGRNAQGKSSVLDAIMAAIGGKAGSKELKRPIRDGESKASVVVELDDLVVERKWTPSGSTVTVSPKGGNAKLNSPQAVLDKLFGALSFDPLAFAEADPKSQVSTLIDLIGRERFDELAQARKAAYDERTDVNREVRSIKARLDALGEVKEVQPVDVVELMNVRDDVRRKANLRAEWEDLQETIERATARQVAIAAAASKLPDGDLADLHRQIQEADATNKAAQRYGQHLELVDELGRVDLRADELTKAVEAADERRANLIAEAPLPVDGLSFDDEGVQFNGVPFVQASAAERLKVSVAMAMALNPELKVICIRDASLLDNESKQALVDMAIEHDYQIWYEVVGEGGPVGIVIEDGQVQA